MKKGRFSLDEQNFIRANADKMDVNQLGEKMDRAPDSIAKWIAENLKVQAIGATLAPSPNTTTAQPESRLAERVEINRELRNSASWASLQLEFTEDELVLFNEKYVSYVAQFKQSGEVMATEEVQIFQAIKFELLMRRNLVGRKEALQSIKTLETIMADFLAKKCPGGSRAGMTDADRDRILVMETQINEARAEEKAFTGEFTKLQERHDKIMTALKATRDQRLTKIEDKKINFLDVIRELQRRDVQETEGRQIELMRLAGENELMRLGQPIKYEDGNEDSPILCAETVNLGREEEDGEVRESVQESG